MRVVLIHRYFWPDIPPYAHILAQVAASLSGAGHEVTVLTCQPSYNKAATGRAPARERLPSGVDVHRWSVLPDRRSSVLKVANLLAFCGRLVLQRRLLAAADVVMTASTPPIVLAKVAAWLARRSGARFIYHKQDVYPEVAVASGVLHDGALARLLARVDARTEASSDTVVVLSEDMADTVTSRGVERRRVSVINNFDPWSDPEQGSDRMRAGLLPAPRSTAGESLHVVFAGNLGRFQSLESLVWAVQDLRDDTRIWFHFFGDGSLRGDLEGAVAGGGLSRVHLHGYRAPDEVAAFLRDCAHVGIVSLAPGVIRAAYPSKTMSYLRNGCPVLAMVEADSELARAVTAYRAGLQVAPGDHHALVRALRRIADEPEMLEGARQRAIDLYRDQFEPSRQLSRWVDLFEATAEVAVAP